MDYRALVVDDDEDIRVVLSRSLRRFDVSADAAMDGVMATNMLRLKRYDALITYLKMPRKHGQSLIMETLAGKNAPVIIAITGVAEPRLTLDLISRGVVDVVQKPFDCELLAAKVKGHLVYRSCVLLPGAANGADQGPQPSPPATPKPTY